MRTDRFVAVFVALFLGLSYPLAAQSELQIPGTDLYLPDTLGFTVGAESQVMYGEYGIMVIELPGVDLTEEINGMLSLSEQPAGADSAVVEERPFAVGPYTGIFMRQEPSTYGQLLFTDGELSGILTALPPPGESGGEPLDTAVLRRLAAHLIHRPPVGDPLEEHPLFDYDRTASPYRFVRYMLQIFAFEDADDSALLVLQLPGSTSEKDAVEMMRGKFSQKKMHLRIQEEGQRTAGKWEGYYNLLELIDDSAVDPGYIQLFASRLGNEILVFQFMHRELLADSSPSLDESLRGFSPR